jgi:ATP-dependent Clp protease ATP-binding subunit ClpC
MIRRGNSPGWARWHELARYGYDLTRALLAQPEPLVQRAELTRRLAGALRSTLGGNVALVGPPGSGKRSALRALAQAIAQRAAPAELLGYQVFWVDVARLVSGARYRGELEQRAEQLGREIAAGYGRFVVILEGAELLSQSDSDSTSGSIALRTLLNAGGIVLPLTAEQAARLAQSVPNWDMLVQVIEMPAWDEESCEAVLRTQLPRLQAHHQVEFAPEAPRLAIWLAQRYMRTHALPGIALQVLDHAAALAHLDGETHVGRARLLETVALHTGLPLSGLDMLSPGSGGERRWLEIEATLAGRVVGQDPAIRAVARALRRARTGLGDPRRPLGSFLFIGPTGVGKTELARALAEFLFGDEESLIRIDMSEYMERHAVARLIGAPPGYVGFGLPGQLTDPVLRRPFSVVLFDEVEKAHPDVLNLLLQILEDGRLTDGYGRTVDFHHTVIVLTSNAGSQEAVGAGERAPEVFLSFAHRLFRPELLNRLDDIVLFAPLSLEAMERVVDLQLERAHRRLSLWGVRVRLSPGARSALARAGHDPELGARPLRRLIDREVLDPIARALLAGELEPGTEIVLDGEPGAWTWWKRGPGQVEEAALGSG